MARIFPLLKTRGAALCDIGSHEEEDEEEEEDYSEEEDCPEDEKWDGVEDCGSALGDCWGD
jgi:hypothetical protein